MHVLSMEPYRFIFKVTAQEVITLWIVECLLFDVMIDVHWRNQDLNLAKQKYKILIGHKNRC